MADVAVTMKLTSGRTYAATITPKAGSAGSVTFIVSGTDTGGRGNSTRLGVVLR